MTPAQRDRLRSYAIATGALLLAAPLGVVAATDARVMVVAGAGALAAGTATAWWFRRDPVMVLVALWAFQIVRTPLAAATESVPFAGTLINQLTDLCVLVILLSVAWEVVSPNAQRRDLRFFWPAIGLAACGLAGSLIHGAPLQPTLVGLWLGTKFWLLVGVTATVAWRPGDIQRALRVVAAFGAAAAGLGVLDAATRGAVADLLNTNLRVTEFGAYRSNAAQSLYAHPNEYSLAMSLLVAIWLAHLATMVKVRRRDAVLLGLFVLAAVVSLRLKAVLSISAVFAIVAALQLRRDRRQTMKVLGAAALTATLVFPLVTDMIGQQLKTYSSSEQATPRGQLYDVGGRIAADNLPFGVGFGRFGSAPSRDSYSDVYDEYELSRVWGLSREFSRFITDTSWPSVLGETGVAGLFVFVSGLLALVLTGVRTLRYARGPDAFAPLALIGVLVVVVVDSVGNSTLFTWNTITAVALVAGATLAQLRAGLSARDELRRDAWLLEPSRRQSGSPRPLASADTR